MNTPHDPFDEKLAASCKRP